MLFRLRDTRCSRKDPPFKEQYKEAITRSPKKGGSFGLQVEIGGLGSSQDAVCDNPRISGRLRRWLRLLHRNHPKPKSPKPNQVPPMGYPPARGRRSPGVCIYIYIHMCIDIHTHIHTCTCGVPGTALRVGSGVWVVNLSCWPQRFRFKVSGVGLRMGCRSQLS